VILPYENRRCSARMNSAPTAGGSDHCHMSAHCDSLLSAGSGLLQPAVSSRVNLRDVGSSRSPTNLPWRCPGGSGNMLELACQGNRRVEGRQYPSNSRRFRAGRFSKISNLEEGLK
jgi:hypothetical protein